MEQHLHIMSLVLAVFTVMGIGGTLRKINWLTSEADASLLKLVVRVLYPCFIFNVIAGNERFMTFAQTWPPPAVGFGSAVLGYAIALSFAAVAGKWIGLKTSVQRQTFALCVGTFNYGYIPIPLVEQLFDDATLGTLVVHNAGVELAIWTVGILVLQGKLGADSWKRMINGPVLAIMAALTVNYFGIHDDLPLFVTKPISLLAQTAIPMGLVLTGATMADHLNRQTLSLRAGGGIMGASVFLRLGIIPLLCLAGGYWMPINIELKRVIIVEAAMPAAVFPILLAKHYGGDTATAIRVVLATSLVAILTIPAAIAAGLQIILN